MEHKRFIHILQTSCSVRKAALWLLSFVVFSCMAVAVPMGSSAVEPSVFAGVCAFLFYRLSFSFFLSFFFVVIVLFFPTN